MRLRVSPFSSQLWPFIWILRLTDFAYQRNQYNSNIVDISGALFKLCLTILILNSQCEVGARDINIIRVTVIICENNINFSVVIIWLIISFHLCKNQNEHWARFFINLQNWYILDIYNRMARSCFIKCQSKRNRNWSKSLKYSAFRSCFIRKKQMYEINKIWKIYHINILAGRNRCGWQMLVTKNVVVWSRFGDPSISILCYLSYKFKNSLRMFEKSVE